MTKAPSRNLGSVADFVMGQAPPGKECNKEGRGTPFVKAGEFEERLPAVREWTTRPLKLAKNGDVLVCVVGATAGKVNQGIDCAIGRSVAAVRPSKALATEYLYHFLATKVHVLRSKSQGLAQGVITRDMLNELCIPAPPIDEQRHIAAVLDKADELRAKRRAALAELDTLTQSIFLEMFGNPATNSMQWPQTTLAEVAAQKANNGIFKKNHEYSSDTHGTVPVVWVEELFRGDALDTGQSRHLPANSNEIQKYGLRKGDILFCRSSLKLDGIAYNNIYEGEDDGALFECHIIRLRPDSSKIDPVFLNVLMRTPSMREVAKSKAKTATMTTIDQHNLGSIPIPLPPLAQQRDFAVRFSEIRRLRKQMEQSLAEMATLFASLQWRAFRGELPKTNK